MKPEYLFFWGLTLFRIVFQIPYELGSIGRKRKTLLKRKSTFYMYACYLFIWAWCAYVGYHLNYSRILVIGGSTVMIVGILMRTLALSTLGRQFSGEIVIYEDHRLISNGIYSYFRHPLHFALILELCGMILFMKAWILFLPWLILIAVILHRNKLEDKILETEFGQEFRDYRARVRF